MAVYVDRLADYGGRRWCYMIADSPDELHDVAARIGLKRDWFRPASFPHYDLSPSKRALAVRHGAIEVSSRELVAKVRSLRNRV